MQQIIDAQLLLIVHGDTENCIDIVSDDITLTSTHNGYFNSAPVTLTS